MREATVQEAKPYELHPAGPVILTCADWQYTGWRKVQYGDADPKFIEEIRFYFLSSDTMDDGRAFGIWTKRYNFKVGPPYQGKMSNLTALLSGWIGRDTASLHGFNPETVIGRYAVSTVVHEIGNKSTVTFANLTAISGAPKGVTGPSIDSYTRRFDEDGLYVDAEKRATWEAAQALVTAERDGEDGHPWDE